MPAPKARFAGNEKLLGLNTGILNAVQLNCDSLIAGVEEIKNTLARPGQTVLAPGPEEPSFHFHMLAGPEQSLMSLPDAHADNDSMTPQSQFRQFRVQVKAALAKINLQIEQMQQRIAQEPDRPSKVMDVTEDIVEFFTHHSDPGNLASAIDIEQRFEDLELRQELQWEALRDTLFSEVSRALPKESAVTSSPPEVGLAHNDSRTIAGISSVSNTSMGSSSHMTAMENRLEDVEIAMRSLQDQQYELAMGALKKRLEDVGIAVKSVQDQQYEMAVQFDRWRLGIQVDDDETARTKEWISSNEARIQHEQGGPGRPNGCLPGCLSPDVGVHHGKCPHHVEQADAYFQIPERHGASGIKGALQKLAYFRVQTMPRHGDHSPDVNTHSPNRAQSEAPAEASFSRERNESVATEQTEIGRPEGCLSGCQNPEVGVHHANVKQADACFNVLETHGAVGGTGAAENRKISQLQLVPAPSGNSSDVDQPSHRSRSCFGSSTSSISTNATGAESETHMQRDMLSPTSQGSGGTHPMHTTSKDVALGNSVPNKVTPRLHMDGNIQKMLDSA